MNSYCKSLLVTYSAVHLRKVHWLNPLIPTLPWGVNCCLSGVWRDIWRLYCVSWLWCSNVRWVKVKHNHIVGLSVGTYIAACMSCCGVCVFFLSSCFGCMWPCADCAGRVGQRTRRQRVEVCQRSERKPCCTEVYRVHRPETSDIYNRFIQGTGESL